VTPAPAERVAALRILVGGFALGYLVLRAPHFWDLAGLEARRWDPVGLFARFGDPLPAAMSRLLLVAAIAGAVAFVTGWRYRVTGPTFAVLLLVVTTARNSWGQVWHTENLLLFHVAILAFAPAAAAWSLDARRSHEPAPEPAVRYAHIAFLMSVVTVATYVLAGVTKLRDGGFDWLTGDVLRNHVAFDNVRKAALGADTSPLAGTVLAHGWVFAPFAWAAMAVELGAPVGLIGRPWRRTWALAAWLFHVAVLALMAISFPYQLSGVAFASLFPVERMRARIPALRRNRGARLAA
jgi:HTTM domain